MLICHCVSNVVGISNSYDDWVIPLISWYFSIFDGIDGVVQTQKQIILAELEDQAKEQQAEEQQAMMEAQQMQAEQEGGGAPMEEGQMPPEQPMA